MQQLYYYLCHSHLFVHAQVAMQRAKVCVRLVSVSGKTHMRLVKSKDAQPEIADHEAAYRDNTGEDACSRCTVERVHSLRLAAGGAELLAAPRPALSTY